MTSPDSTTVCAWHGDRATALRCTTCDRPICVDCSHDAPVGQKCPECAKPIGRARVIDARTITAPAIRRAVVTMVVLAINVVIALAMANNEIADRLVLEYGLAAAFVDAGEWWRAFTSMFLHGGLMHLAFNMWALWLVGPALETRHGSAAFASLYLAAGLSGSAAYLAGGSQGFAVGASGAIFGLFGALLIGAFRQRHTMAGRAVFNQLVLLLGINLLLPLILPRIAWEAHLGGLVAGVFIAAVWDRLPRDQGGQWLRAGVALAVAAVALGLVFVV